MNIPFLEGVIAITRKTAEADALSAFRGLVEYQEKLFQLERWGRTNSKHATEKIDGCTEYLREKGFDREYLEILKDQYSEWQPQNRG